jgi:hypothetical protein
VVSFSLNSPLRLHEVWAVQAIKMNIPTMASTNATSLYLMPPLILCNATGLNDAANVPLNQAHISLGERSR